MHTGCQRPCRDTLHIKAGLVTEVYTGGEEQPCSQIGFPLSVCLDRINGGGWTR